MYSQFVHLLNTARIHAYKLYQRLWLDTRDLRTKKPSNSFLICAIVWILEWLIMIEYIFGEWTRSALIQAVRVPTLMVVCLVYWFWLWGMAVWRRTQYGKFTRGERKLWAKALTAFWVAELVTVASFILVMAWVSWGPTPIIFRTFLVSRKGIILEFVIFSYILFLTNAAKYLLKWNSRNTQIFLSCTIMCLLSYIFWKDILLLVMRENLNLPSATRWRNIRTNLIVYTLSHEWWTSHATTHRAPLAIYNSLHLALIEGIKPDLATIPTLSQYNTNNTILCIHKSTRAAAAFPILQHLMDYTSSYNPMSKYMQPTAAYPRRTGFVPKRLALWQLLMILKMWHHVVLLIWWTLYMYRTLFRHKTSYTFLSSCGFNIYCCLILAGLIYLTYFFPRYELFIKFQPQHLTFHKLSVQTHSGWIYLKNLMTHWNTSNATPSIPTFGYLS